MSWTARQQRAFAHGLLLFEAALLFALATMHHVVSRPAYAMLLIGPLVFLGFTAFGVAYRLRMVKTALAALVMQCGLVIYIFAAVFAEFGMLDPLGNVIHDRTDALYFSVVTWTTLGYGDMRPLVELRLVAASEALLGYLHMGLLVPFIWWMLTEHSDARRAADEDKLADLPEVHWSSPRERVAARHVPKLRAGGE